MNETTTYFAKPTRCLKQSKSSGDTICKGARQPKGRMNNGDNEGCIMANRQSEGNEAMGKINNTTDYPIRKERRRTETMNMAFTHLREHIPNVPTDTKLSKIKTLRLAISYIRYLMEILDDQDKRDQNIAMSIANQYDTKEKRKKEFEHEYLPKRKRGRTGWPQKVWALELQNE